MFYIQGVLSRERTVTAGTEATYDLPVNPLSFATVRLTALQAALNTPLTPANFLSYITAVDVMWRGSSIWSASLEDVVMMAGALGGYWPDFQNHGNLANQRVSAVFRIPFGRWAYGGSELLPPVRRGELQLRLRYAAAFTGAASLIEHVETVEVPDATPARFLKVTTLPKTPTAAGEHDVDLPIGNPLLGCLLFSTTVPAGAAATTSIDSVELLVDNVEFFLTAHFWEELHQAFLSRIGYAAARMFDHQHMYDPTIASANQVTDRTQGATFSLRRYGWLEFDPRHDPEMAYALITAGRSRVALRITAGDTQPIRVLPVEMISIAPRE